MLTIKHAKCGTHKSCTKSVKRLQKYYATILKVRIFKENKKIQTLTLYLIR